MVEKKLKIVMLLSRIDQSGLTKNTIDISKGLSDLGHEILLITGGISENEQSARVFVFLRMFEEMGVNIKTFKKPSGNILKKSIKSLVGLFGMLNEIKKFNPNIIHAQSPYMTFIPWLLRKKFTTTIHQMGLKRNFLFKTPTHIIAISEESKNDSIKNYKVEEDRVTIIHHGVPNLFSISISEEEKAKLKFRNKIPQDKLIIGSVSILTYRKGIDLIVNALKGLSAEAKEKIHFIFLGDDANSDRAKNLRQMIAEADIGSITSHIPFQNPKPFYDIMDIFVLPSRQESFPLVTLEAMMSGCCPVRSNTEGAYEQIEHGVTGLLFQNGDYEEFGNSLEKLIFDDLLREKLSKNTKQMAMERFTIAKMTENTLKVYDKIRIY
jgi:glycosyltransferase involved in cell wall biosynthesis